MTKVVSVVGSSKRGKTTLLRQLTVQLRKRGYTVCVVKHSQKRLTYQDFDRKGKNTYTFSEAGADEVWLTSPCLTYHVRKEEVTLEEILRAVKTDFVLTEGFKEAETKKIVMKEPGEEISVKGEILLTIEGEHNLEDIVNLIVHS